MGSVLCLPILRWLTLRLMRGVSETFGILLRAQTVLVGGCSRGEKDLGLYTRARDRFEN